MGRWLVAATVILPAEPHGRPTNPAEWPGAHSSWSAGHSRHPRISALAAPVSTGSGRVAASGAPRAVQGRRPPLCIGPPLPRAGDCCLAPGCSQESAGCGAHARQPIPQANGPAPGPVPARARTRREQNKGPAPGRPPLGPRPNGGRHWVDWLLSSYLTAPSSLEQSGRPRSNDTRGPGRKPNQTGRPPTVA